jgi:hypothetical protein
LREAKGRKGCSAIHGWMDGCLKFKVCKLIKFQSNTTGGSNVMCYLKMKNITLEIQKKHDMFQPLSEVIIRHYKDKTDLKNSYKQMVVRPNGIP